MTPGPPIGRDPAERNRHTAVWTGTEMIVWGGEGSGYVYLNTGGRYDPTTDSWTPTSTTNAPAGRYRHTAVWTGTEMIVWGGYNGSYLNTGGRYCAVVAGPGEPTTLRVSKLGGTLVFTWTAPGAQCGETER